MLPYLLVHVCVFFRRFSSQTYMKKNQRFSYLIFYINIDFTYIYSLSKEASLMSTISIILIAESSYFCFNLFLNSNIAPSINTVLFWHHGCSDVVNLSNSAYLISAYFRVKLIDLIIDLCLLLILLD